MYIYTYIYVYTYIKYKIQLVLSEFTGNPCNQLHVMRKNKNISKTKLSSVIYKSLTDPNRPFSFDFYTYTQAHTVKENKHKCQGSPYWTALLFSGKRAIFTCL